MQSPGLEGASGLLGSRDRRLLCPELKEREGSSRDADAKARMLVKKKKKAYLDDCILFLMPKLCCNNWRFIILST